MLNIKKPYASTTEKPITQATMQSALLIAMNIAKENLGNHPYQNINYETILS